MPAYGTLYHGVSGDQFIGMVRRWSKGNNIDLSNIKDNIILEVYNYLTQILPVRLHYNSGNITLSARYDQRVGVNAIQIDKTGNVFGLARKNETTRSISNSTRPSVINRGNAIPDEAKRDIDASKNIQEITNPDYRTESARLMQGMLYLRLIRQGKVPKDLKRSFHGNTKRGQEESPEVQAIKNSLMKLCLSFEKRRRYLVGKRFLSHLDRDILEAMQTVGRTDSRIYNWLNADGDKALTKIRIQAVRYHPHLIPFLIEEGEKVGVGSRQIIGISKYLTATIDSRKPLIPALATLLAAPNNEDAPFPKQAAKFLLKLGEKDVPEECQKRLFPLLQTLSQFNPNWYPKTPDEWTSFLICVSTAKEFRDLTNGSYTEKECLLETGGKWSDYCAIIEKHGPIRDCRDWFKALHTKLIVPKLVAEGCTSTIKNSEELFNPTFFLRGHKLRDILESSLLWHKDIATFTNEIAGLAPIQKDKQHIEWPSLSDPVTAPNGILIKPLTTPKDLKEEGSAQKHCVDGYSSSCLYESSHIVSLRNKGTGDRLVTVELRERWDKAVNPDKPSEIYVAQSQGYQRRPPTLEEKEATSWYLRTIKPDWDHITAKRSKAQKDRPINDLILRIGFDPRDAESRRRAYEICRPYLPTASQRDMSYERWFQKTGINDFIRSLEKQDAPTPLEAHPDYLNAQAIMNRQDALRQFARGNA